MYTHSWDAFLYSMMSASRVAEATPNTFKSNPEPREGFIDARRQDGCIPVITSI